jgi:hypothetical protein
LVERMLALLEKGLPDPFRATLLFTLGKACDDSVIMPQRSGILMLQTQ